MIGSRSYPIMATFIVSDEQELREALDTASASTEPNTIILSPSFGTVELSDTPLTYSGDQQLTIIGNGATLTQDNPEVDIFVSDGGADLAIRDLTLEGGNRGIWVPLPADETGTVKVSLTNVTVTDTFFHGVHIDDQINNSDASVELNLTNSFIDNNGRVGVFGEENSSSSDSDGVRVDEGGLGDATVNIRNSVITNNGADGLEIDERGSGTAYLKVSNSTFDANGPWDPNDVDDGIDVDEADEGSIVATISNTTINNNFDEGLDLDEAGDGTVKLNVRNVEINENGDEGLKITEEGPGDIITGWNNLTTVGNGDDGIQLEQFGGGVVFVNGRRVFSSDNQADGVRIDSYQSDDEAVFAPAYFDLNRFSSTGNSDDSLDVRAGVPGLVTLRNPLFEGNGNDLPDLIGGVLLT